MKLNRLALIVLILLLWGGLNLKAIAQQSTFLVKSGIQYGISGLALLEHTDNSVSFLAVHDNKIIPDQPGLAVVKIENNIPQYIPIEVPFTIDFPADLEAITRVPGEDELSFMALTSKGTVYHFSLNDDFNTVTLIKVFDLPSRGLPSNLEGFSLQKINNQVVAVWGHRGDTRKPGIMYWGLLDLTTYQITPQGFTKTTVPFPINNVRHISDLKIDSAGVVYLSAAMDMGDNGPFESAVYVAGVLYSDNEQIKWRESDLFPLYKIDQHKVEAIEIIPGIEGGMILGTDDENQGSYLINPQY